MYYRLAKPGMVYGNMLPAIAGYAIASHGIIEPIKMIGSLAGLLLVMGSSCIINNIRDSHMDRMMQRTSRRATATGAAPYNQALMVALVLVMIGLISLYSSAHWIAVLCVLLGWILYAGVYTSLKPRSVYATLVGSVPGAIPPVVGYTAVYGHVDVVTIMLFIMLITWQLVHFYAIAIRCRHDYQMAKIPVYSIVYGIPATVQAMRIYGLLYCTCAILLAWILSLSSVWLVLIVIVHLGLLYVLFGSSSRSSEWAKRTFVISITGLTLWCVVTTVAVALG